MREGKSIVDLANELDRQAKSRKDYVVDSQSLEMVSARELKPGVTAPVPTEQDYHQVPKLAFVTNGGEKTVCGPNKVQHQVALKPVAHRQVAQRLGIPQRYYERLQQDHPDLLAHQVTGLMQREPKRTMLRCLDGKIRAVVSDKYRPIDNYELMETCLPVLSKLGVEIVSADVTDTRLYIKFVAMQIKATIMQMRADHQGWQEVEETISAGGVISNSEVGMGSLAISHSDWWHWCANLAIREHAVRKTHLGRSAAGALGQEAEAFFRDETRKKQDDALLSGLADVLRAMMDQEAFSLRVQGYKNARTEKIDPALAPAFVSAFAKEKALPEPTRRGILDELLKGGEFSKLGLMTAVTAHSAREESYDQATDLERLGGQVIEMPRRSWTALEKEAKKIHEAA